MKVFLALLVVSTSIVTNLVAPTPHECTSKTPCQDLHHSPSSIPDTKDGNIPITTAALLTVASICYEQNLTSSIQRCSGFDDSEAVVYVPDYIYASRKADKCPHCKPPKHTGDFMLMETVVIGAKFVTMPLMDAFSETMPRIVLNNSLEGIFNFTNVASLAPLHKNGWSDQINYVHQFCGTDRHIKECIYTGAGLEAYTNKHFLTHVAKFATTTPTMDTSLKVLNVSKVFENAPVIACHSVAFPFQLFACHTLKNFTLLKIEGDEGVGERLVSCHGDTSIWGPIHPAWAKLKVPIGTPNICHHENEVALFFG